MHDEWQRIFYKGRGKEPGDAVLAEASIDASSPWFSGHFPNEPILPGIAILSMVTDVIKRYESDNGRRIRISGIRRVRFRLPVRPDASLQISLSSSGRDTYHFTVALNGETACSGLVDIEY
jgi:3-hydroxyacyl-[acyl-carrier-protein] dehydratase